MENQSNPATDQGNKFRINRQLAHYKCIAGIFSNIIGNGHK